VTLIPCNFAAVIPGVRADKLREVLLRTETVPMVKGFLALGRARLLNATAGLGSATY